MQNQLNTIDVTQLHPMLYRDMPVCTTERLAQCYGTKPEHLRKNYNRNTDKFQEGTHFVKLEGAALAGFRESLSDTHEISFNARTVTLWTERGAARHAKMLETDEAWEVFEKLEDSYFQRSPDFVRPPAVRPGQVEALQAERNASEVLTPASLQAMLDKPMQITVREYLALTQAKAVIPVIATPQAAPQAEREHGQHYTEELRAQVDDLGNKGWLPSEIADRTGIQLNTVKTMLFRSRKAGRIARGPRQGTRTRDAKGGAA